MTPNQGNDPSDPRTRQQPGTGGRPPQQPPQQPAGQQPQGRPMQGQSAQGQPTQGRPMQGGPTQGQMQTQQMPAPQVQPPSGAGHGHQVQPPQQSGGPPQSRGVPQQPQPAAPPQGGPAQPRAAVGQPSPGVRLEPVTVDDFVQEDVVTAQRDTPVQTVVAEMAEKNVGSVVVVDNDEPIGVITDRKVALALEETPDIAQSHAEELLDGDLVTADPSMSLFEALEVMSNEGIRRLPIVDEDEQLQGIITLDDVLVIIGTELGHAAETIETQSPRI